jgi:uncharacterized phage protein gp47/JayE
MGNLMACEIQRPSAQALFDRNRDMFSTTVLRGGSVIPESNEWYVVSLNYAVAEEFYAFSEQMWKERDPRYACCENLMDIAARDGVFPYAATFAQGYVQVNGTPGAALPAQIEIDIGGQIYISEGTLITVMPPEGYTVLRVRSETAGATGNGQVPATGEITTVIPGIEQDVTVFGGFCGGEDAEECEQFRSRYLARKQFAPRAIASWVESKLLEWPCVTRVCARSGSCCVLNMNGQTCDCGSALGYYVFMDNTFSCGIPPQCIVDQLNEWMFGPEDQRGYGLGQVEVGVCGEIYLQKAATVNVTVSDYGCITNSQKNEIRARITEFFTTLCPSSEINNNQIGAIVGSVLGYQASYAVDSEPAAEDADMFTQLGVDFASCGYEMNCDVIACLGTVTFLDTVPEGGAC